VLAAVRFKLQVWCTGLSSPNPIEVKILFVFPVILNASEGAVYLYAKELNPSFLGMTSCPEQKDVTKSGTILPS